MNKTGSVIATEKEHMGRKGREITPVTPMDIRKNIIRLESKMRKLPGALIGDSPEYLAVCPLKHAFADGMYIREIFLPKGMLFVTKIHKITHPYFLLEGDCSVLTEDGIKRIKGPFSGITPAGTKRVIYTHEDTRWITVHATKETDLVKIEEEIIAKTYAELGMDVDEDIEKNKLMNFVQEVSKLQKEYMNCGFVALKKLSKLKNISMRTLIDLAQDNGLKLYPYKVPLEKISLVSRPAIFHAEDHFIYIPPEKTILDNLKYTGYILLTQKAHYPKIRSVDLKRITGGSWGAIAVTVSTAMTVNSMMQMIQGPPKIDTVSTPGVAAARGLPPAVARELQRQQTELERLHQEELIYAEERKKLEEQTPTQKIQVIINKYGWFVITGGVILGVVLLSRRKRWLAKRN